MGNWFKTTLLLGALTALIVWIGNLFGGRQGMILAFVLAVGMNFFSYWFSDRIVLKMYRAREVTPEQNPEIYQGALICLSPKSISSRMTLPTPLPRAGTRNMQWLPLQRAC